MRISCLQMEVAKGKPDVNLAKLRSFAARAHDQKTDLLLLPEMWTGGFAYRELARIAEETPAILKEIGRMASGFGMAVAGSMPEADGDKLFNTLYVVDVDGFVKASYRKLHLFPLFKEDMFIERGSEIVSTEISGFDIGLAVCFDLRFPELFRKLSIRGSRLVLVSAQWPKERLDHWRLLNTARAVENQIYIAAANASGRAGMTTFAGHSMIVDPRGRILAEGDEKESLVWADIDFSVVDSARKEVDYIGLRIKDIDEFLTTN